MRRKDERRRRKDTELVTVGGPASGQPGPQGGPGRLGHGARALPGSEAEGGGLPVESSLLPGRLPSCQRWSGLPLALGPRGAAGTQDFFPGLTAAAICWCHQGMPEIITCEWV